MKISRTGSAADHGTREIAFPAPVIKWSNPKAALVIRQGRVKDFATSAHHSYTVEVNLDEVNAMLGALAKAALAEPTAAERNLAPSLKSLVQLQLIVAGLYALESDRE